MFDPTIGRWQTKDPKSFDAGDTNLYRYVGNHPTMATDPSGLFEEGIKKPGEQWRIFNIFASNPDQAKYVVRKVGGDGPPYAQPFKGVSRAASFSRFQQNTESR